MRQLTYALRFRGAAQRVGPDGNVLEAATTAPGCTVVSRIADNGLSGSLRPALGGEARVESELTYTGATTFQQAGTIAFGAGGHRLRFSTVGSGYLDPAATDTRRHGAAIWRVDGGEGQFAGASGLIASNVVVDDAGEVTDHHLGVVYVREAAGSAEVFDLGGRRRPAPRERRSRRSWARHSRRIGNPAPVAWEHPNPTLAPSSPRSREGEVERWTDGRSWPVRSG